MSAARAQQKIVIGLVAKSQSNPVFQAAYSGAKDAALELGPRYGVTVEIDWQTPPDEDAQKQAEAIETLARSGHVAALYAQDCYGWGYKSVEILLEKLIDGRAPESERVIDPLTRVTAENVAAFGRNWDKWLDE